MTLFFCHLPHIAGRSKCLLKILTIVEAEDELTLIILPITYSDLFDRKVIFSINLKILNMNLDELIKGDIKEYCIACLDKNSEMLNLKENTNKRELFTNLFNIEVRFDFLIFDKINIFSFSSIISKIILISCVLPVIKNWIWLTVSSRM